MSFVRRIAVSVVLCALSTTLLSAQAHDVAGSKDHPLISRYPGSVIDEYCFEGVRCVHAASGKNGTGRDCEESAVGG